MPEHYSFLIANGPNLGHLGLRQPEIYGRLGMEAVPPLLERLLGDSAALVALSFFQSNSEGSLLDRLEAARTEGLHGIVLNAGAYTHTSLALADCLAWIGLPVVEVHLSNILARSESIRRQSLIGPHVIGLIAGFGILGYALGVLSLLEHVSRKPCSTTPTG
ncbi:MAG: 3-dehydroquinate dehydratase [Deltaproteobacteria bacterium]|nr:3-dehydroquinate dehydratase [Deltaproteobacteria bacterium]